MQFLNCYRPICLSFRSETKESAFLHSTTVYTITRTARPTTLCTMSKNALLQIGLRNLGGVFNLLNRGEGEAKLLEGIGLGRVEVGDRGV